MGIEPEGAGALPVSHWGGRRHFEGNGERASASAP